MRREGACQTHHDHFDSIYDPLPHAMTKLAQTLRARREAILEEWLKEQLSATNRRGDLINERDLRDESGQFLALLTTALETDGSRDLRRAHFKPVLEMLTDLSRSRNTKGFSPTETANFIFSLKRPLGSTLRKEYAADPAAQLEMTWEINELLDALGLYTNEAYLQSREDVIRRQQEEMLELSTPVVQLWDGIVALPLIGTLDSARTSVVMETLLKTVVETRSEIAIIDITGVPTVDTLVAQHLLKTVAAARLMGADCIISGIRPQIAQTMVHLQIDLSTVSTKATMAEALRLAMKRTGLTVVKATKAAGEPA